MKKVLSVVLAVFFVAHIINILPVAMAQNCDLAKEVQTDIGCIPKDPAGFSSRIYSIGLSVIGGVALLFLIWGGILLLTSQGNPGQVAKGRGFIMYAVIGLLLAIFGFVFVELLLVDVLQIPGFSA